MTCKRSKFFERRVAKSIFGGVRENNVWRRRMNRELAQLYGKPSIRKSQRLVVLGGMDKSQECRIDRMHANQTRKLVKLVFKSNPVGIGNVGRQRAR